MLDRLEKAGLIERWPNPSDRRGTLIVPSKPAAEKAIIVPEWAICDPAIIALATFKTGSVDGLFWAITDSEGEVLEDLDDGDEE